MTALTIGWEYLTGYTVATDPGNRECAEWPPHPARVFMALAAAWFETGEDSEEGQALCWLESLEDDPELYLPQTDLGFERSRVTVYVPVNDKAGPSPAALQSVPSMTRAKQPRMFPRRWVGMQPCYLCWRDVDHVERHRGAFDRLCAKVTRIGHSSSLVRMWVESAIPPTSESSDTWLPDQVGARVHVRRTSPGMLAMLADRYGETPRRRRAELTQQIASLHAEKKSIKGKGAAGRKLAIDSALEELTQELANTVEYPPVRPAIGRWSGYRRADERRLEAKPWHSQFDTDLLVLKYVAGPALPLASTLVVTRAVRDTIMRHSGVQPAPAWVSGHKSDGTPLQDEGGHLAVIPLPFVGYRQADGHLLGVALVFPRSIDRRERGRVLGRVLLDDSGCAKKVRLSLGQLGVWIVEKLSWGEYQQALRAEIWTAHSVGANTWASVTPVVLDRFPKTDRAKNRVDWTAEVSEILCQACIRIGLPAPIEVAIDTTSSHVGSPRSLAKHRRLRGHVLTEPSQSVPFGEGFPPYPAKGKNASWPQVHVRIRFAEPVIGPVVLGAGRYRGYGLFKPWKGGHS